MLYIAMGVLGFVCFLLFDFTSLKKRIVSKYVFMFLGIGLLVFNTVKIIEDVNYFVVPTFFRFISLALSIVFFILLVYSVFIEVGIHTYNRIASHRLVTKGTYSLVRHPGVIWLFLAYLFAAIYFANMYLLVAAFIWTAVNAVYILIQERFILTKIFTDYNQYVNSTPMLIPNITSLKKFITLQNWRKE